MFLHGKMRLSNVFWFPASGFDGPTTLEIAGEEAVKLSAERLRQWSAC